MANKDRHNTDDDSWVGIYWKPAAAVIYLMICIFDFVIVPTYMGIWAPRLHEIIMAIKDLPGDAQTVVLNLELAPWEPLTLKGGGLFHVAFGAILGATVWSRGQERINEIRHGQNFGNSPYGGGNNCPPEGEIDPTHQMAIDQTR